jgi:hypothetical protein
MKSKIVKNRKGKYDNDVDRVNAINRNKLKSYHKCKPVKSKVKLLYGNFNDRYRSGLFRYLITKDYYVMVTFTHKGKVTKQQTTSFLKADTYLI